MSIRFKIQLTCGCLTFWLFASLWSFCQGQVRSTMNQQKNNQKPEGYFNLPTQTLGGKQFWTDFRNVDGWRVQQNAVTNHFRLIDSRNVRRAWGNQAHCDQVLNQLIRKGRVKETTGKVVILLHGLVRTSSSMRPLAKHLKKEGFQPVLFSYASSRKRIGEHAKALNQVVKNLGPKVTEIHFVGHSMGNIVVRRYLKDQTNPNSGKQGDQRIKHIVMIGPPNHGSRLATLFSNSVVFKSIAGVGGVELGAGWKNLEKTLATPTTPFGIIAGGQIKDTDWNNFLLNGPDDFTVSLDEAKLKGAADLLVRPLFHSTMMHQPETLETTTRFLKNGYFHSEKTKAPIK